MEQLGHAIEHAVDVEIVLQSYYHEGHGNCSWTEAVFASLPQAERLVLRQPRSFGCTVTHRLLNSHLRQVFFFHLCEI